MNDYRKLKTEEIAILENQECRCDDWSIITVADAFDPSLIRRSRFRGAIKLGARCRIEDVRIIECTGKSTYGCGLPVSVLRETGGKEVIMHTALSWDEALTAALSRKPQKPAPAPDSMCIGDDVSICGCGTIRDVWVGPNARIEGSLRLTDGCICSNAYAPCMVGEGVIADHFIIHSGSEVTDASTLKKCFVGQACHIGCGFSAEESMFFANCQMEKGEACAILAGPYTVSHHKATLMVAGIFSYYNAGSNTNFSNHLYKSGPVHWGICGKGVKTASGSHVVWPANIGEYTFVSGHHGGHPDTSELPFSYLIEYKEKSLLLPGVMLKSCGLRRDEAKWKARDKRTDPVLLDRLECEVFSNDMIIAIDKAKRLLESLRREPDGYYRWKGCLIAEAAYLKGLRYYDLALDKFRRGGTELDALVEEDMLNEQNLSNYFN